MYAVVLVNLLYKHTPLQ